MKPVMVLIVAVFLLIISCSTPKPPATTYVEHVRTLGPAIDVCYLAWGKDIHSKAHTECQKVQTGMTKTQVDALVGGQVNRGKSTTSVLGTTVVDVWVIYSGNDRYTYLRFENDVLTAVIGA